MNASIDSLLRELKNNHRLSMKASSKSSLGRHSQRQALVAQKLNLQLIFYKSGMGKDEN